MRQKLMVTASVLAAMLVAEGVADACGGNFASEDAGAAQLLRSDEAVVLDASQYDFLWQRGPKPFSSLETVYDLDDQPGVRFRPGHMPPTIWAAPGGGRMVAQDYLGRLWDLSDRGVDEIRVAEEWITGVDVAFDETGAPLVLLSGEEETRLFLGGSDPAGIWTELAVGGPACSGHSISLVLEDSGLPVGLCGGRVLSFDAGAITVEADTGAIAVPAATGTKDAKGDALFFLLEQPENGTAQVQRIRRDGAGGWVRETVVDLGRNIGSDARVAPATPQSLAIATTEQFGKTWTVESVYFAGAGYQVDVIDSAWDVHGPLPLSAAGAVPQILTGHIELLLHERGDTGYTSTSIALIGEAREPRGGCAIAVPTGRAGGTSALVLLLSLPLALALRRRLSR